MVEALGGLHGFTGWRGPWLTDSGGYQVTSLSDRARLDEEGVVFQSPLDGRRRKLTPEGAIAIQEALGSDIAMVLDECLPIRGDGESRVDVREHERALLRTLRWAERSRAARRRPEQAVFAIVQGAPTSACAAGARRRRRRSTSTATPTAGSASARHGRSGARRSLPRMPCCPPIARAT